MLEAAGLLRVHFHNGLVHRYELLGNYQVNPGQPNRLPQEPPRTTRQYEARNPGQSGSHQLRLNELPSRETENKVAATGPKDPWAKFRHDPVAQKAAQLAITKKK